MTVPFTGIHHVRVPVADLDEAVSFWGDAFGFAEEFAFPGRAGVAMRQPGGGPSVVLWADEARARAMSGAVAFGLGVADRAALAELAVQLDRAGVAHGAITPALVDEKLVDIHGPDGGLITVYVMPGTAPRMRIPA